MLTIDGSIDLLIQIDALPDTVNCDKCCNSLEIRYANNIDCREYRCVKKCRSKKSIKKILKIYCPNSLSIHAFTRILLEYFPDGFNTS